MTFLQILGFILMTLPIIGITCALVWTDGIGVALKVWGLFFIIWAIAGTGIYLFCGGK